MYKSDVDSWTYTLLVFKKHDFIRLYEVVHNSGDTSFAVTNYQDTTVECVGSK